MRPWAVGFLFLFDLFSSCSLPIIPHVAPGQGSLLKRNKSMVLTIGDIGSLVKKIEGKVLVLPSLPKSNLGCHIMSL